MPRTLGYHIVISGYGLWLPGDRRGHWSEAWDAELGYIEPHQLHVGDPIRKRMAEERQKHPPVKLAGPMIEVVAETLEQCAVGSDWQVAAASIESTHTHLLLTYTERDVDNTVKWLKDQLTKSIHRKRRIMVLFGAKGVSGPSFSTLKYGVTRAAISNATTNAAASDRGPTNSSVAIDAT
ncbi:MAG: hypothetical protein H0T51_09900 [Pirellulales bacterium]|nr:hypothetical protein [Pirellulales bacterium]